uniref:adenine phosphoribosyltransferase n=2 Tax=Opuntia streptacantha TaxID=393608 RepID=A0A7C9DNF7_OPUST
MYPLARCSAAPRVGGAFRFQVESSRAFPSRGKNSPRVVAVTTTHAWSAHLTLNLPHSFIPSSRPHTPACVGAGGDLDTSSKMAFESEAPQDDRIARIASTIRVIPDFPKPGIIFQDITTMLLDPKAFKDTIDLFVERYSGKGISVVAGIEARGFIFGPPIALAIGAKFVPLRKPGKLPGKVISEEYSLEYGTDIMEMHVGAVEAGERGIIIDDLIATGGTLSAAIKLLERVEAEVVECACVIELPELKGRERLGGKPLFVLIKSA